MEIHGPVIPARDKLTVTGDQGTFTVPLILHHPKVIAQFSLYRAGVYVVSVNGYDRVISVSPRQDLPFKLEFGLVSVLVTLILGGLIVWAKKKRQKRLAGPS